MTPTITLTPTPTLTPTTRIALFIQKIVADPEYPLDEYVDILNNTGEIVDMTGWTLRDESENIFTFPIFALPQGKSVRIYTGPGEDEIYTLYWGRSEQVWNDVSDCGWLRNLDRIVDGYCYGTFFGSLLEITSP